MSRFAYILVPRSTLDSSDQDGDLIQSPREQLFRLSLDLNRLSLKCAYNADADGADVLDPEHVALMEAVCEAADALPCCDLSRDYPRGSCSGCSQKPVCDTTAALTAHREERGL